MNRMRLAHFIEIRVFSKEEDDEDGIKEVLRSLFAIDQADDKLQIKSKISFGFDDKKIKILSIHAVKQKYIDAVLSNLVANLSGEQKELLLKQKESRLDRQLHFYLRLEKDRLLQGEYWITDTGNCFHIRIALAAYPHKRGVASLMLDDWLKKL